MASKRDAEQPDKSGSSIAKMRKNCKEKAVIPSKRLKKNGPGIMRSLLTDF